MDRCNVQGWSVRVNVSRELGLASKPFTFFRFNRNYGFTPSALRTLVLQAEKYDCLSTAKGAGLSTANNSGLCTAKGMTLPTAKSMTVSPPPKVRASPPPTIRVSAPRKSMTLPTAKNMTVSPPPKVRRRVTGFVLFRALSIVLCTRSCKEFLPLNSAWSQQLHDCISLLSSAYAGNCGVYCNWISTQEIQKVKYRTFQTLISNWTLLLT
mgnify:CR=1 FL=1